MLCPVLCVRAPDSSSRQKTQYTLTPTGAVLIRSMALIEVNDGGHESAGLPRLNVGAAPTCSAGCTRHRNPLGHQAGGVCGPVLANKPPISLVLDAAKKMRWIRALEKSVEGSGVI